MYDNNYELEECMGFLLGVIIAVLLLAVVLSSYILAFAYFSWPLFFFLVFCIWGILKLARSDLDAD